jgi:8-oxo-dGTP pyrophosphatase MutT (NUDIX family)
MDITRAKSLLEQHTLAPSQWKGAVLFLCNDDHVFLIKRSDSMPSHGGQIAFVGGHRQGDEIDPWDVAQREFEEETHHLRTCIDYVGTLPVVMTARHQPIVPVVARLLMPTEQFLSEIKSNGEWDEVIAYPWSSLLREESWEFAWRHGTSMSPVLFHTIRAGAYLPVEKNWKPHILWGATANMIWSFLKLYFAKDPHE